MIDDEEFNEKFATVAEALKYISESQAKSEWIHKRDYHIHLKEIAAIREIQDKTQKHLEHISKLIGIAFEELEFQDNKLEEAGKVLSQKRL